MPWIPQLKVTGGLIGGSTIPDGYLDDCLNNFILDTPGHGLTTSGSMLRGMIQDEETARWKGAFGRNILSQIYGYAETHVGEQTNDITLAEMVCALPQGAQYWRQTIALVINVGYPTIDETQDYKILHFVPYFMKIERREYATPYADAYTSTTLNDLYGNLTRQVFLLAGDEEDARGFFADSMIVGAGSFSYDGNNYYGFSIYGRKHRYDGEANRSSICLLGITQTTLDSAFGGTFDPEKQTDPNEDPNNPGNEEGGGEGGHNRPVDPIPSPDPHNGLTATTSGFITMYCAIHRQLMQHFASAMFASNIWEAIKLYFSNPIDFIVGCSILPYRPTLGDVYYPKFGAGKVFSHGLPVVEEQFKKFDFGSIYIEEYGRNCFDYDPYTKIQLFLPYIGFVSLKTDEVMGKNLKVEYMCDALSGDCIAFVSTQVVPQGLRPPVNVVIGSYTGNVAVQIPIGQVSYDNIINASLSLGASLYSAGAGLIAGTGPSDSDMGGIASSSINMLNGVKGEAKRSGSSGGTTGMMGIEYPYIIRTFPRQSLPDNYNKFMGYPSNISGTLGDGFSGFAEVEDIQLNNIPAMEEERAEIMDLLRKGVLL